MKAIISVTGALLFSLALPQNTLAATLAAGGSHSLALRSEGAIFSWGYNTKGQLGNSYSTNTMQIPIRPAAVSGAISVAAGASHSLVLKSDGSMQAWGSNSGGQLGNANTTDSLDPLTVQVLTSGVSAIAAGSAHSLALKGGIVYAWGSNSNGQLGLGSTQYYTVPQAVTKLSGNVTAIATSADANFSLALKSDGTVWAWGNNDYGQLGNGITLSNSYYYYYSNSVYSSVPVQVAGLSGIIAIAAGGNHALALRSDGVVFAWGNNDSCELGYLNATSGTTCVASSTAKSVPGLSGVTSIYAGSYLSAATKADGTVWLWGSNRFGQLGNKSAIGDNKVSMTPVQAYGLTGINEVAIGSSHVIARNATGQVFAWGNDIYGQLGDGRLGIDPNSTITSSSTPGYYFYAAAPTQVFGPGGDGFLSLALPGAIGAITNTPVSSICSDSASLSDVVYLTVPCINFLGGNYSLRLQQDASRNDAVYFKLIGYGRN